MPGTQGTASTQAVMFLFAVNQLNVTDFRNLRLFAHEKPGKVFKDLTELDDCED